MSNDSKNIKEFVTNKVIEHLVKEKREVDLMRQILKNSTCAHCGDLIKLCETRFNCAICNTDACPLCFSKINDDDGYWWEERCTKLKTVHTCMDCGNITLDPQSCFCKGNYNFRRESLFQEYCIRKK
jgi:hypothetical protein